MKSRTMISVKMKKIKKGEIRETDSSSGIISDGH